MCNSFDGREDKRLVVIVTGGAGAGIGGGITEALAKRKWHVFIADSDSDRIEEIQRSLVQQGFSVDGLAIDITSTGAADQVVRHVLRRYGRLDGLVNNAGVGLCKPAGEVQDDEFERLVDVDLRAVFRFTRAALRAMLSKGGSIVNIGSSHAHRTIKGYSVYSAIKSAIEAFTRGIAVDYGERNIRANCVHPGLVASPQNYALIEQFEPDVEGWLASYSRTKQSLPTLVTAQDVGNLVGFLLSSEATMITGQNITIDAGTSAMLFERGASY